MAVQLTGVELTALRLAIVLYLLASTASLLQLLAGRRRGGLLAWWPAFLAGGFLAQGAAIVARSLAAGYLPVASLQEALYLLGWLLVGAFLAIQVGRPLVAIGAVVSPLAFAFSLTAYAVRAGVRALPSTLQSAWMPVHVLLSMLGDTIFGLAFSVSLIYLIQERRLRAKRPAGLGALRGLPSLETLDRWNYRFLIWGLVLLTLGILSGIIWAHISWGHLWSWEWKLILSLATWLIYVVLLQGRISAGWRGRRAAILTIIGFVVIVASLLGVSLLGLGRHGTLLSARG